MKYVAGIMSIYLLLSIFLYTQVSDEHAHFDIDSFGYHDIAENFYRNNQLLNPIAPEQAPVQPAGYPFFMGLVYKLCGVQVSAIIGVQIILTAMSIVLLMAVAELLFGPSVATVCGTNLSFLVYPQFVLAEALLLFFLLFFFYCFVRFMRDGSIGYVSVAACILGISTIIKPTALCFPLIIVPVVIWRLRRSMYLAFRVSLLFLLLFFVPIMLYMLRNYYLYGYFSFAPMMPLNMYQCLLAKVISRIEHVPVQQIVDTQLRFTAENSFDPVGWAQAKKLFYQYLWRYPHIFVFVWLQNVCKTVFGLFSTQLKLLIEPAMHGGDCSFFAMQGTLFERMHAYIVYGITHQWLLYVAYAEAIWSIVRWVLVVSGFVLLLQEKKYGLVCIFVLCIVQFCVVTGMDGCCRYRITCEPLLLLISAYTIVLMYNAIKRKVCI